MGRRLLAKLDLEYASLQEIQGIADFLAGQMGSVSPKDVAYTAYAASAVTQEPKLVKKMRNAALAQYKKNLLQWFKHALIKRANVGGGGSGIKKIQEALSKFVKDIPAAVISGKPPEIELPATADKYFKLQLLPRIAQKVTNVVSADAKEAGLWVPKQTGKYPVEVHYWKPFRHWYIPKKYRKWTIDHKRDLPRYGFRWAPQLGYWYAEWKSNKVPASAQKDFTIVYPGKDPALAPPELQVVKDWYFGTWLPNNVDRFSRVFSNVAKSEETSYQFTFTVDSEGNVTVKMRRDIKDMADAIEELRHRYLGRQGREPWLEVMDKVIELAGASDPTKLMLIIDRVNNLQHSNGLFMEHFPKDVLAWYEKFLNAKYHSPTATDMAAYISDSDIREMIRWADKRRPAPLEEPGYQYMEKETPQGEEGKMWRQKGYPRQPGYKQPSRRAPEVQEGIERVRHVARRVVARYMMLTRAR